MDEATPEAGPAKLKPGMAAIILVAIVILIGIYSVIGTLAGCGPGLIAGYMFAFYWGSIKEASPGEVAPTLVGGLCGLGAAYLIHLMPILWPAIGLPLVLGLVAVLIYLLLIQLLPIAINNAMMLYLTIGTAGIFKTGQTFVAAAGALVLAAAYMTALLIGIPRILAARRATA